SVTIEWFDTREGALDAERLAVASENPLHNIALRAANDNRPRRNRVNQSTTRDLSLPDLEFDFCRVYVVREIKTKLFQGIFWASNYADLWDAFDEFGDPYGYEFAAIDTPGALCHPTTGVDTSE